MTPVLWKQRQEDDGTLEASLGYTWGWLMPKSVDGEEVASLSGALQTPAAIFLGVFSILVQLSNETPEEG